MGLNISHNFVSLKDDVEDDTIVKPSDWNANHIVDDFYGFKLVEAKEVSAVTEAVFSGLDGEAHEEYLLDFDLTANKAAEIQLLYNGDTTTGYYTNYIHLQETDTNHYAGTNWTNALTFGRFYNTAPYKTIGNIQIKVFNDAGCSHRTEFCMFPAGWGEGGGFYKPVTFTNLTTLSMKVVVSGATFSGKIRLYRKIL